MSAISTYLEYIRSKIYAKDVRTAIVNAISQCYDDVNKPALQTEAMQAAVQAKINAGQMAALTIADGSLTGAKLANGTIPTSKIADGAITTAKIADGAVTGAKVGTGALTGVNIANKAIGTTKIDDSAVTWQKLAPQAVHTTEIADGAVTSAKLGNVAVTTVKIANKAITKEKLADDVVPDVDPTLLVSGMPADAKVVGDEIADLKSDLSETENEIIRTAGVVEELECGLTEEVKAALLACFAHVAWISDDGQTYYDALSNALNRSRVLSSIRAVFTQGSATIYDTDELYALKQYLTVTVTYSDGTTKEVNNYTLSGKLVAGTNTITVAYNKKTTTFNVTVTHQAKTLESISATFNPSASITTDNVLDDLRPYLTVRAFYSNGSTNTIANYALSGSLNVGTNTITVTYNNKTVTFTVNVTQAEKTLQSITAVFNQGSTVIYTDNTLNDLKPYLTVTARYSDGTTQTVTGYTLSGTLTAGTSTITASYGGKTATFNVNVTQAEVTLQSITATFTQGSVVIYTDSSLNSLKPYLVVTARYSDGTTQTITGYTLSGTLTTGTSTITASYGGKTATFNVVVTERVTPPTPSADPVYALSETTEFNGTSDYIDTGLQLMGSNKSNITIVFDILDKSMPAHNAQKALFHCMHEVSPWPGNCIQFSYDYRNVTKELDFDTNSNTSGSSIKVTALPLTSDGIREKFVGIIDFELGTVKALVNIADADVDYMESDALPFNIGSTVVTENALIGCYQTSTGAKGRYWKGTVYDFKIYNYAWSDNEAQAYLREDHS